LAEQKDIVLYLDDDPTNLSLFEMVFKDRYEVIITTSSLEAFKIMEGQEVKVVMVDYSMPEISGLEFISRASIMHPDTIFMIITAYADLNFPVNSISQINVFRFFSKPWREFDVDQAIRQALHTYRLRHENRRLLVDLKSKNRELILLKEKLEEENLYFREEIKLNADFENIITGNSSFQKSIETD
jgi:DNA-binding NtrC family response regulator